MTKRLDVICQKCKEKLNSHPLDEDSLSSLVGRIASIIRNHNTVFHNDSIKMVEAKEEEKPKDEPQPTPTTGDPPS